MNVLDIGREDVSLFWQEDIDITENRKQIAFDIDTNVAERTPGRYEGMYRNRYEEELER